MRKPLVHIYRSRIIRRTIGEGFHSEDLAGQLQKLDPNESGALDRFSFVRWCADKEVSLESS